MLNFFQQIKASNQYDCVKNSTKKSPFSNICQKRPRGFLDSIQCVIIIQELLLFYPILYMLTRKSLGNSWRGTLGEWGGSERCYSRKQFGLASTWPWWRFRTLSGIESHFTVMLKWRELFIDITQVKIDLIYFFAGYDRDLQSKRVRKQATSLQGKDLWRVKWCLKKWNYSGRMPEAATDGV